MGYDVFKALEFIMDADLEDSVMAKRFTLLDKEIAGVMHDAISNLPSKNSYHFRIHTKGVGIFSKMREDIEPNSLVVEYFGEIYRQWYWYEK
jgi:hypothetical protein